ncbi:hypothetical protein G5714_015832 [Onychostoma macrolepis]|uniref:Uncharacterized protein n=1 Tax=Onychostoma macrolepis TaxID=369639 RepID=A0A7J6C6N8_9TELE|nr:hypothetical protein G5714_015832 [Onychostoma macrolepis]
MFTRLLSLWVTGALLLPLNWGTTLGSEDDDEDVTPTPDYDYNATFDYYLYNGTSVINYEMYEILHDTKNQGNTDSVSVYRHYGILAGLLVLHICQQT